MTYHSNEINGKAKNHVLKYGAYLRGDSSPCNKECKEREVGCRSWCKKGQEWDRKHKLALAELQQMKEQTDISHLQPKSKSEWDKYRIKENPRIRRD